MSLSFISYVNKVEALLKKQYNITTDDVGISFDELASAQEDNQSPHDYVTWFAKTHNLTKYGDKVNYHKIDIYARGRDTKEFTYKASTTWARTCKEAKERYAEANAIPVSYVKANRSN